MNFYLDTSALVKRYLRESGSEEVALLVAEAEFVACSIVTLAEVLSAVGRARRSQLIPGEVAEAARQRFLDDEAAISWLALDPGLAREAGAVAWRHGLRGFDAIQVATALRWASSLDVSAITFATFDKALAAAAAAEGLAVWPAALP